MVYILETKLLENKSLRFALNKVYGIGKYQANTICKSLGFSNNIKVKDLTEKQTLKIVRFVEKRNILTGSDLKQELRINNKKLVSAKSYRGLRKLNGLPVRGQRTHTNAQSARKKNRSNIFKKGVYLL